VGVPDASLTPASGVVAVAELVGRLGVTAALDDAVGSVKQRDRGLSAGEFLVAVAQAQMLGAQFWVGLDRRRLGRGSPVGVGHIDTGHELAVGGARGGEVFVAFFELEAQVDGLLFEVGDPLVEGFDVDWGAEPGLPPGLCAERFGQALFEVVDVGAQPGGTFVGGE
jgi:hypothetical protein